MIATCELQVLYQLPLSVKAYGSTSNKQKVINEKKPLQIGDRTFMHSLFFHNLQWNYKSSSPNTPEHLHCSAWHLAETLLFSKSFTFRKFHLFWKGTQLAQIHQEQSWTLGRINLQDICVVPKPLNPLLRFICAAFHFWSFSSTVHAGKKTSADMRFLC